ncbi:DNA cytosine methyltransferase [Carboxylicivirga caseinilyticus]|uniref:DNA cytosine methyltransferase n=1 Tax=Carboxylicivirga caseinilyticus TaxID=3417572 RepID=UPI003D33DDF5|nr:DNA cytosine methyltransferase [Marinilabiliaceae bacterium A049]
MKELRDKLSIEEQVKMLNYCILNEIPLHEELKNKSLSYDNLRYNNYVNGFNRQGKAESLNDIVPSTENIPAISFFSGAGGLDIGFKYAGFNNLASIENTELFCNTLRLNNPEKIVIGPSDFTGDVRERETLKDILIKNVGISKNFNGVFHGGPPCQPFSIASNQRFKKQDDNFKRLGFEDKEKGNLLFDYLWFIEYFLPKAFLIENVPGLGELDEADLIQKHLDKLSNLGYSITKPTVINSADYGVPQNRRRLFIIGIKGKNNFEFPKPNVFQSASYDVFHTDLDGIENHVTRNHTAESILRYIQLDYGMRDQRGRVDRLNPFLPSKTVIAGGTKGGGRSHLHPYSPRTLSARESARLQTFPDNYIFTGSAARQFTQVGNAVPPLLAYKLALGIKKTLPNTRS